MKTKTSILFYAKRARINAKGQFPIYTRITVNGRRIEFSIGRNVTAVKWSSEKGKMKGQSEEARSINKHLDILKTKIIDIQMEFIHTKTPISAKIFKSKVLGEDAKRRMLIPIFEDHNRRIEELVGKEYAPGTLQRYKTSLKHTKEFLEWKYKESDIDILKFNQYVGIIQVAGLTIQIHPKADKDDDDNRWQNVLLKMLKTCGKLNAQTAGAANVKKQHLYLLEVYFERYLVEVETLIRQGLIEQYRKQNQNT